MATDFSPTYVLVIMIMIIYHIEIAHTSMHGRSRANATSKGTPLDNTYPFGLLLVENISPPPQLFENHLKTLDCVVAFATPFNSHCAMLPYMFCHASQLGWRKPFVHFESCVAHATEQLRKGSLHMLAKPIHCPSRPLSKTSTTKVEFPSAVKVICSNAQGL